jgi:hypothetical protein
VSIPPSRSGGTDRHRLAFLYRLVEKRRPELVPRLAELERHTLSADEREVLRELVADELTEVGLRDNDEPTGYGLVLESIINWLGKI